VSLIIPNCLMFMKYNWFKISMSLRISIRIATGVDSLGSYGVTLCENGNLFMRGSIIGFLVHCSIVIFSGTIGIKF